MSSPNATIEAGLITAAVAFVLGVGGWIVSGKGKKDESDGTVKVAQIAAVTAEKQRETDERQSLNDDLQAAITTYKEMVIGMRAEMKERDEEHTREMLAVNVKLDRLKDDLAAMRRQSDLDHAARLEAERKSRNLEEAAATAQLTATAAHERADEAERKRDEIAARLDAIVANAKHIDEPPKGTS